jgi:hypothetical protein
VSDQGKKLGIAGGILAAIGAAVAHGADDCAKVGARSAAEVGAVRGATQAGDDLAKLGAKGAAVEGVAAEGVGVRGARGVAVGETPGAKIAAGAAADESAVGQPWRDLSAEIGQDLAPDALESLLSTSDGEKELDLGKLPSQSYELISVVPNDRVGALLAFGKDVKIERYDGLARAGQPGKGLLATTPSSRRELHLALGNQPNPATRFVLGYVAPDDKQALATPDQEFHIPLAEVAARCLSVGARCLILVCEKYDFSDSEPCAARARAMVDAVVAKKPAAAGKALALLGEERKKREAIALGVYGAVRVKGKLRLAASQPPE